MTDNIADYRNLLAAERGISDEDRDLLMTGTDEETLLAQANLLEPLPELTHGNVARNEGKHVDPPSSDNTTMRDFAEHLFGTLD